MLRFFSSTPHRDRSTRSAPSYVAGMYLLFGLFWIWLTDRLFVWLGMSGEPAYLVAALKGTIFVLLSAGIVYWLVQRSLALVVQKTNVLQAVAEGTVDAIFVKDVVGKYLLLNRTALSLIEKTSEEALGKDDAELFGVDKAKQFRAQDERIMWAKAIETEERVLTIRGVARTYLVTKSPYRDTEGNVLGVIGISRDITDQKQADAALRASEERYRNLVELAPDGIGVLQEGKVVYLNHAATRILGGNQPSDCLGLPLNDYVHPDDLPTVLEHQVVIQQEQCSIPMHEVRLRRLNNEYIPLEVCSGPCQHNGAPAIQILARDITARKHAEQALRESEERYRTLVELSADAIFINRGGKIVYANPTMLRLLGATALEQILDKTPFDFTHSDFHPLIRQRIQQMLESRQPVPAIYQQFVRLDGTLLDVEVTAVPFMDRGSVSIEVIARDITQRKQAEEVIRKHHLFRETMIRTAAEGICVCQALPTHPYVTFTVWNDRMEELTGYTLDEINRLGWYESIYPNAEIRERAIERMTRMRDGDDLRAEEWQITRKDGTTRVVAISTSMIETEEGQASMAVMQDITERKRAEQALRDSEARNRQLIEVLPSAVFVLVEGDLAYCNPACVKLMGAKNSAELLGRKALDIAHPDYHAVVQERFAQMRQTGMTSLGIEMRVTRLDGRTVPVYSVSTPLSVEKPFSVLVALSDLTEREQALEWNRSVMRSVTDAILTIDERGRILAVNEATTRIFGYAEAELLGQNVNRLMPDPMHTDHDSYIHNYLRTGIPKMIGGLRESEGIRRDGTTFPVELNVSEFSFNERRRFTGVVRDISARRRLETQILHAQKMQAVGRLAGGIAHDFNNMLMIINGHSDLMLKALPDDDLQRLNIEAIHEAGQRAARLTVQLLAFSRKAKIEPRQIDLNQLLVETTKLLQPLIGSKIALITETEAAATFIRMDRGQLEQVLANLVINARDAMPHGGRITLRTQHFTLTPNDFTNADTASLKPGLYALLVVTDTGVGISEAVRARMFEPFFTTKDVGQGTGLGLAVVDGIVAQAGGHISVTSHVGVGTTFTLWFPIHNVPDDSAAL